MPIYVIAAEVEDPEYGDVVGHEVLGYSADKATAERIAIAKNREIRREIGARDLMKDAVGAEIRRVAPKLSPLPEWPDTATRAQQKEIYRAWQAERTRVEAIARENCKYLTFTDEQCEQRCSSYTTNYVVLELVELSHG